MALTINTDFKCVDKAGDPLPICFGIGAIHDQFKTLQVLINRFATLGDKFTPIIVDGFIGDETLAAAQKAATIANATAPTTREELAAAAPELITQLQAMVRDLEAVGVLQSSATPAEVVATQQEPPPPEIKSVIQQVVDACRESRSSPACTRAKTMCKSVRGTEQAKAIEISEICDATRVPLFVWIIAGGIAAAAIGTIVAVRRYRRRQHTAELGYDEEWWEGRRPGRAQALRKAGFRQIPCDVPSSPNVVMRCWEKRPKR